MQKEYFEDEAAAHKNELVLMGLEIVRLTGVIAEDEDDYYWVIENLRNLRIEWWSCVGGFTPLKPYLPEEEYEKLERQFNLNWVDLPGLNDE